jgi:beta-barrel assembly-enhancing protease
MPRILVTLLCLALPLQGLGEGLPDLGDASQSTFSPQLERKIGEQVVREIRQYEPSYFDDPDVIDYLNNLGYRLVASSPQATQDFEFFALKDPTLNAFALPGGFIFVHTGTIVAAESESELASVLAHEIGHVVQRHMARQVEQQAQTTLPLMVAMLIGILAARSNAQIGQAAVMGAQATAIQSQLNYSRDYEREADRVGLQILRDAGFDVHAMPVFFERLQRYTRIYEGRAPAYLRTHPVTSERIADIENRIQNVGFRQSPDSIEFQLVRAKLKADQDRPEEAVSVFAKELRDKTYASPVAAHYGLARAYLRAGKFAAAQREVETTRELTVGSRDLRSPMLENLAGQVRLGAGDSAGALAVYAEALRTYPHSKALIYANGEALLAAKHTPAAASFVNSELQVFPRDEKLFDLQARIFQAQGKQLAQHRALGEMMVLRGNLVAAIDQYQLAQKSPDGDFFEQSGIDARLRELRRMREDEEKEQKLLK